MRDIAVSGGKLFLICAVAAISLGLVNAITDPVIEQRKVMELQKTLNVLAPNIETGEPRKVLENETVANVYPLAGGEEGYILELIGEGYGGEMKILARYDRDGTIQAARLMENEETPGLGKKAEDPAYMEKFVGTGNREEPVAVRKDMLNPKEADAITGATITFIGVAKALAEGAEYIREGS